MRRATAVGSTPATSSVRSAIAPYQASRHRASGQLPLGVGAEERPRLRIGPDPFGQQPGSARR